MILSQTLLTQVSKSQTKPAWRWLGKETLYKDALQSIARLSYLYQREIGHDQRVAFFCSNAPAVITTFFAMTNVKSVIIPIDPYLPPADAAQWIRDTKATQLAVTSDLLPQARELVANERLGIPIIEIEKKKGGEYDTSFTPQPDHVPKDTDTVLLLRTSGITGKPKYVAFNHKQIAHAAAAIKGHYRMGPNDRILGTLHWSHGFALLHGMLFPILSGSTVVIDHGLQALEFLDFIIEARVTRLIGIPAFFLKILILCRNEKRLLPGIKSITVGLGSLDGSIRKTYGLLKIAVLQTYGMTENLWTIAMEALPSSEAAESKKGEAPVYVRGQAGKGIAGVKYKVMDDSGDEVEGREKRMGQLALSGPSIMQNYPYLEKDTKNALRGTWLYTGDIAELEGEGEDLKIRFICRKADLFRVKEQRVDLNDIDVHIRAIQQIQDGAAFAVKNAKDKPVLVCAIVKKAGVQVSEKQILDFLAGRLSAESVPIAVAFTDEIPRDKGGNVNLHKLRGQFSGIAG